MSKLLEQVKALQDEAHTCPKCGGDGVLYGQMGYNGCATEYTCYRCNGTKRVPNPGVDKLVSVIEVLVRPLEVHLQRLKHECECPLCKLEFTCGEGDEFDEDGRYATIDCIRLVMDGLPDEEGSHV